MILFRVIRNLALSVMLAAPPVLADDAAFIAWTAQGDGILAPLGGLRGDAQRGRALVIRQDKGNRMSSTWREHALSFRAYRRLQ